MDELDLGELLQHASWLGSAPVPAPAPRRELTNESVASVSSEGSIMFHSDPNLLTPEQQQQQQQQAALQADPLLPAQVQQAVLQMEEAQQLELQQLWAQQQQLEEQEQLLLQEQLQQEHDDHHQQQTEGLCRSRRLRALAPLRREVDGWPQERSEMLASIDVLRSANAALVERIDELNAIMVQAGLGSAVLNAASFQEM